MSGRFLWVALEKVATVCKTVQMWLWNSAILGEAADCLYGNEENK